jgi:ribose transport system substrate-binding protein
MIRTARTAAEGLPSLIAAIVKSRVFTAILFFATTALVGCSSSDMDHNPKAQGGKDVTPARPKVALIMKSLANEFFATMATGAEEHQTKNATVYDLVINGIKDERDLSRQSALVDEMVAAGVQAIVIAPADSKALIPTLRRAQKAGVVVVNIDNRLDQEILAREKITIPFIGPNNRSGAKRVGEYLAKNLASGDKVAILEGIRTSFNGTERRLGFEEAMQQASMKIVSSQSAQWETNLASTIVASMIVEHGDIKGILAANDSMAIGAIAAIKSAGKVGEIKVVGFDNIQAAQSMIREGTMLATADQHGDQLAVYGIELALQVLRAKSDKANGDAVTDQETPVDLITRDNLLSDPPSPGR